MVPETKVPHPSIRSGPGAWSAKVLLDGEELTRIRRCTVVFDPKDRVVVNLEMEPESVELDLDDPRIMVCLPVSPSPTTVPEAIEIDSSA